MAKFLLEIGTEELPPKQIDGLVSSLANNLEKRLKDLSLNFSGVKTFSSPRRIAVLIKDLESRQSDKEVTKKGPSVAAAFDKEGNPTVAATKFAQALGVDVSKLERIEEKNKTFLSHTFLDKGKDAVSLLPELILESIKKIPIKKAMFWGEKKGPFVRPVHWILALFDDKIIDLEIFGIKSSNKTFGHRFHHPGEITISNPDQYEKPLLDQGKVIVDSKRRQEIIREQIKKAVKNGIAAISEELISEVTNIVEWPVALVGSFEERFLKIPKEVLVTTLKEHQRCFPIIDQEKNLLPNFVVVSNIESKDEKEVIAGNEKVIRARFSDAEYFYEEDTGQNLADNLERLKNITFQEGLGTLFDKTLRLQNLASFIAEKIDANPKDAERAAALSKCDLVSSMVWEFPELQGIMGYYYSLPKEKKDVSIAIKEQYLPRFSKDGLPETKLGGALALADRIDNLVGLFGVDKIPTGDKDPLGLRRAATGVVNIVLEKNLELDLKEIFTKSFESYSCVLKNKEETINKLIEFIYDRLLAIYKEQDKDVNIFRAILACKSNNLQDFVLRFEAVDRFAKLPESEDLIEIYKRIKNILSKNASSQEIKFDPSLIKQEEEKVLANLIKDKEGVIQKLFSDRKYPEHLKELIKFKKPLNDFFDNVMVMDKDEKIRNNRLALLKMLQELFVLVSDLSYLISGV